MKKNILVALLLMVSIISFSQPTINLAPAIQTDYLKKSKKQSTIALTTGIPGCILLIVGGIMYMSEFGDGLRPGEPDYDESTAKTGKVLMIAGGAIIAVAIPFQLAARKNKKLAMTMGLRYKPIGSSHNSSFTAKYIPSLGLKINLR